MSSSKQYTKKEYCNCVYAITTAFCHHDLSSCLPVLDLYYPNITWIWLVIYSLFDMLCIHLVVSQCTTGFTNESSLSNISLVTRAGYQFLFLSVNFSCAAQITSFVIPAQENPDISGQSTQYPYIQIYRPGSSNTYNRVYTIGAITEEVTYIDNITDSVTGNIIMNASLYEYTPINQTITVLPNDVLGMFVIPSNSGNPRTQIIPYFGEVNGPQYVELPVTASSNVSIIFAGSNLQTQLSPLIDVDISKLLI